MVLAANTVQAIPLPTDECALVLSALDPVIQSIKESRNEKHFHRRPLKKKSIVQSLNGYVPFGRRPKLPAKESSVHTEPGI